MLKKVIYVLMFVLIVNFVVINIITAEEEKGISLESRDSIIIDDKVISEDMNAIIGQGKILIPVKVIKDNIINDLFIDKQNSRLHIQFEKPAFRLEKSSLNDRIKDGIKLNFPMDTIDDISYLNIYGMEKLFNIKISYLENEHKLIIDKLKDTIKKGKIIKDTVLKEENKLLLIHPSIEKLEKHEEVVVFDELDNYYKVRSGRGSIGIVLKDKVKVKTEKVNYNKQLNQVRENFYPNEKLNLVWHHITKTTPDISGEETIEGLDVIMPTWFSMNNKNGYIVNKGNAKYVEDAHSKGYKVWALVDNSFDKDLTKEFLYNEESRNNLINQLVIYSSLYDLDGINIDFENVYYEDKDAFTNFVKELTQKLKEQNLIVSIDMTVPSSSLTWSKFYDRKNLSKIVDYCMIMAYDETSRGSKKSGSVASINWVEKGIQNTIKAGIPSDKILLGMPFYTREWEESKDQKGNVVVDSKALSMEEARERIDSHNLIPVWLKDYGQHYIEYSKDGKKYRIWMEDDKSIELKASLIHKYNLKGVSSWRKGFEEKHIWATINNVINIAGVAKNIKN